MRASTRSFADLAALLVAAHLDPVVDQVLQRARGNLYGVNELNRLGELSSTTQIRIASNATKMSEFALGWSDEHDLSEPLTGAVFDLMLDLYQANLVERGLIPRTLAALARRARASARVRADDPGRVRPLVPARARRVPPAPSTTPATGWVAGWPMSCDDCTAIA